MRWIIVPITLMSLAGLAHAQREAPVARGELGRRLDAHVSRAVPFGFAGIAMVARGDSVLLAGGYGLAQREPARPYAASTIVPLGSIVKAFTRAAIYALAADGRLALTDTLGRFFPGLAPEKARITLAQVVAHRAGLPLYTGDDDAALSRDEAMRRTFAPPLLFEPGTREAYSNPGFTVLAAIIEDVSGRDLEGFVRERLLLPAGMRETGLHHVAWDPARLAHAYGPAGRDLGTMRDLPGEAPRLTWALHGAGGWLSTAEDMRRWYRALAAGRILPAEFARLLLEGREPGVAFIAGGDGVTESAASYRVADGTFAFASNNAMGPLAAGLVSDLVRLSTGREAAAPPAVAQTMPAGWERLAGTYALADGSTIVLEARDGALLAVGDGQRAMESLGGGLAAESRVAAARYTARTDSLIAATNRGDWAPLHRAMDTGAPLEEFRARMQGGREGAAQRFGPYRGHRVLGTTPRGRLLTSMVRLDFERGATYELFEWDGDRIAGVGMLNRAPATRLHPTPDGAWVAWDLRTRRGATLRLANDRLTIASPDGDVTATRR